jgi:hypothetical protein
MNNDVPSPEHVRPTTAPATHDLGGAPEAASGLARHPLLIFTVLALVLSWLVDLWAPSRDRSGPR